MIAPLPIDVRPCPHDPRGLGGLMVLVDARPRPLPLERVTVRAEIIGDVARTVVEQRFTNPYTSALEAIHIFPLPERGAVVEMELRAGDTVVRAECRERVEAERTYQAAVSQGHRAALLTAEGADVHTLRVANLPPGAAATVRLVLVERLEAQDGRLRWRFPTVVAPRYTPGQPVGHAGPGVSADTDQAPDASRLTPPLRLQGGTTLDLEVRLSGPLRHLSSSLHALSLALEDGGVRVAPSANATLDRDFLLSWSTGLPDAFATRAWTDGRHTLVVVEPPLDVLPPALPRDAVFVVDISGSMGGEKMDAAKRALTTALHGLMDGDRFQLLAFDDRLERFSADFLPYGQRTLAEADRWVEQLQARGGTEMLPAIQAALAGETPAGRLRTVLFITDGQATNEAQLVAAVAGRRRAARFFTLGIDTAVNASLMERLARVGGGVATLCAPSDDIEAVVARIESRFGSPLLTDIVVEGGASARPEPEALFVGAPVSLLLEGAPAQLSLRAVSASGPWSAVVAPRTIATQLGVAWARERVAWLEEQLALKPFQDEALRGEILRVALGQGIASRFTAFVAVDTTVKTSGERVTVVQPVELPAGWDQERFAAAPTTRSRSQAAPGGPPRPPAPAPMAAPRPAPAAASKMRMARSAAPREEAEMDADDLLSGLMDAMPAPPPAPPMASAPATPQRAELARAAKKEAVSSDPSARLAAMQSADGSFGADPARTAAALVLLVLLGHTRRAGLRQRVVQKAARWLEGRAEPVAALALTLLASAEQGHPPVRDASWAPLLSAGEEGQMLAAATAARV